MPAAFTESVVEEAALAWFAQLGYEVRFGPDIAHDGPNPERAGYHDVILAGRLRDAVTIINPSASPKPATPPSPASPSSARPPSSRPTAPSTISWSTASPSRSSATARSAAS